MDIQLLKENNKILKQLVTNKSNKEQLQLVVSSNTSYLSTQLNPAMRVWNDKSYEIAGVDLEMYYSFPNITT